VGIVKNRAITMIGIAAVFGAVSIFAADFWLKSQASTRVETRTVEVPAGPKVEFKTIVVASKPLAFGTALDRDQLTQIPWPQDSLPQGAFETIDAVLAGGSRVVLSPIDPNEPILLTKLSGPNGRASLSNLLTPGMRAVAIKTDEIAGVGGFVTPGDRVDVVLTRDAGDIEETKQSATGAAGSKIATEVVVENVRVLSVGQGADERQTGPQIASSVTIEVNADDAGKIALARNIGALSLQLRAAGEATSTVNGLTTIQAFGGSISKTFSQAGGAVADAVAKQPEGPVLATVVVTRGVESSQSYVVPGAPAGSELALAKPVDPARTSGMPGEGAEAGVGARQVSAVPAANPGDSQQGSAVPPQQAKAPAESSKVSALPDEEAEIPVDTGKVSAVLAERAEVPLPRARPPKATLADNESAARARPDKSNSTDYFTTTPGLY
jgi:pilus assembly protein CpaB